MDKNQNKNERIVLLGAAFLMATSAIGPGFLTQTATYTQSEGPNFGFVILVSLAFALIAQLNIWRVIAVAGKRGQDIANGVLPGLGYVMAFAVAFGGLAFNIGNVGGTALGINSIVGVDINIAQAIAAVIAIGIFMSKSAGSVMDRLTQVLGAMMIVLILVVAFMTKAPVGTALKHTFLPTTLPILAILTLIGGTVGGYIPFSGGHRLIDAGVVGEKNLKKVNRSAIMGISVAAIVRVLLFLAILGVVTQGNKLDSANPAGSAFEIAAGNPGKILFGFVLLAAGLSSVVGAAYTSVSFLKTLFKPIADNDRLVTILFIAASTLISIFIGSPAFMLVIAGTINGFILPGMLAIILVASRKKSIVGEYKHSTVLTVLGWVVVALTLAMGVRAVINLF